MNRGCPGPSYPPVVLVPAEPELSSGDRRALAKAVRQFNHGRFFACHETLEGVWARLRGPSRDFFQALIQVSVGFHHLERGNRTGALRTFSKALLRFEAYPAHYLGFDVAAARARLRASPTGAPPIWRLDDLAPDKEGPEIMTRDELIDHFKMTRHPEGGAFVETYRSHLVIEAPGLPGPRPVSTAIYFLLGRGEFSAFHRIRSDEMWHFYLGGPLRIVEIDPSGRSRETTLGREIDKGQSPTHVVEAGNWFASFPAPGSEFSFAGCTVAPGFDFQDFELADRRELSGRFPEHAALIETLTRGRF